MIAMNGGYPTKKSFKEDGIGKYFADVANNPSMFDPSMPDGGTHAVVGPEAYVRKWYAEVTVEAGVITRIT